jgi:hypothetical protein
MQPARGLLKLWTKVTGTDSDHRDLEKTAMVTANAIGKPGRLAIRSEVSFRSIMHRAF